MKIPRIVVFVLALMGCAGCDRSRHPMLPGELTGEWTTDDPRYQDRFLELSPTFVITGTGRGEAPRVEWIDKVEAVPVGNDTEFKVYSTDLSLGSHGEMSFVFSSANGGEIRFRNQSRVWRTKHQKRAGG